MVNQMASCIMLGRETYNTKASTQHWRGESAEEAIQSLPDIRTGKHGGGTQTLMCFRQRVNPIHQHQNQGDIDNIIRRAKAPQAGKEDVHAEAGLGGGGGGGKEGLPPAARPAAGARHGGKAGMEGQL